MTFYEAALRVLEREGKPLHISAIVEVALKENLLSHVGKSPEEVMQNRLLTMARRRAERKVVATAPLTYGLVEWGLNEDLAALAVVPEAPNENEKPLRPRERHPIPSPEKVRIAGRGERLRKVGRREDEGEDRKRRRRFPPLPEVAFEVLSQADGPMAAVDLAASARERDLVSEDLGAEGLVHALREDNRRRSEAGRRPVFLFSAGGEISIARGATSAEPTADLETVLGFASAGLPEARPERGPGASRIIGQAAEHRRQILRLVRRRLGDLDATAFERAALALLEALGFRDAKVAKRSKEGPLVVARRKDGLAELRWAVKVVKGGPEIERADVDELRKDALHFGAQLGVIISPADVMREARQAAQSTGELPVLLWCSEAVADKFIDARLGASSLTVEVLDLDEDFFRRCRDKGREEERSRRGREERLPPPLPLLEVVPEMPAATAASTPAPAAATSPAAEATVPGAASAAAPPPAEVAAAPASEALADVPEVSSSASTGGAPDWVRATQAPSAGAAVEQVGAGENQAAQRTAAEERRSAEERLRAEAHERIEAAELEARLKRAPTT